MSSRPPSSSAALFLYVLAIFFPPLAVVLAGGSHVCANVIINILLCILGWVPGIIHAWWVISRGERKARRSNNVVHREPARWPTSSAHDGPFMRSVPVYDGAPNGGATTPPSSNIPAYVPTSGAPRTPVTSNRPAYDADYKTANGPPPKKY